MCSLVTSSTITLATAVSFMPVNNWISAGLCRDVGLQRAGLCHRCYNTVSSNLLRVLKSHTTFSVLLPICRWQAGTLLSFPSPITNGQRRTALFAHSGTVSYASAPSASPEPAHTWKRATRTTTTVRPLRAAVGGAVRPPQRGPARCPRRAAATAAGPLPGRPR